MVVNDCKYGNCALCGKERELKLSHIKPKFEFKALKKNALTGNIRRSDKPNLRTQDGLKIYLLCEDCEQRFSKLEKRFADNIYHPIRVKEHEFTYSYEGDWIKRYLISVAWRCLKHSFIINDFNGFHDNEIKEILDKVEDWRKFLLSDDLINEDCVYLIPMTQKYFDKNIFPSDITYNYANSAVEFDKEINQAGNWGFVYIKMAYLVGIVSFICEKEINSKGIKINNDKGLLWKEEIKIPELVSWKIENNYKILTSRVKNLSEDQLIKILKDAKKNLYRLEKTETFKALSKMGYTRKDIEELINKYNI